MKIRKAEPIEEIEVEAGDLLEWRDDNDYIKFIVIFVDSNYINGITIYDNRLINTTNLYDLHLVTFWDDKQRYKLTHLSKAKDIQENMLKYYLSYKY